MQSRFWSSGCQIGFVWVHRRRRGGIPIKVTLSFHHIARTKLRVQLLLVKSAGARAGVCHMMRIALSVPRGKRRVACRPRKEEKAGDALVQASMAPPDRNPGPEPCRHTWGSPRLSDHLLAVVTKSESVRRARTVCGSLAACQLGRQRRAKGHRPDRVSLPVWMVWTIC